ncbi:hypothetical protein [Paenibacillus sp. 23TSA30-6]|uniref:hypothetical protein n=1 Tax=Paenibacillus sp. 23TSA30-6 TaxID=2546104 RepID=UPI00178807B2|nr:hypothetical protein [Paenibacillus sp. 23TSA30-6]MBE0338701.1 hypothetical protein [Paenibacillus sp. 23TSA30-6]
MKLYTSKDLANKYYVTEKTVINYIKQICENLNLNIRDFQRVNEKKIKEYVLTEEQEALFGAIIKNIDNDPYVTKKRSYSNSNESDIKSHRDDLIREIDTFTISSLKEKIQNTEEYKLALEFKDVHDQFDQLRDCILFLLEQMPSKDRLDIEKQILSATKNVAHNLIVRFTDKLKNEAIEELEEVYEDGTYSIPDDNEVALKVVELLGKKLTSKKSDIQFNYGGLNLVEQAIAKMLDESV